MSRHVKGSSISCSNIGGFSSAWTILALTGVIKCPIQSHYPPCNGQEDKTLSILNIKLGKEEPGKEIHIMWSRVASSTSKTWLPNHFVPLCKVQSNLKQSSPKNENSSLNFEAFMEETDLHNISKIEDDDEEVLDESPEISEETNKCIKSLDFKSTSFENVLSRSSEKQNNSSLSISYDLPLPSITPKKRMRLSDSKTKMNDESRSLSAPAREKPLSGKLNNHFLETR